MKRKVMLVEKELAYVQDGLLLYLDGRDAPVNNAWIDRVGKAQCIISGDVTYDSENKCYRSGDAGTQQIALPDSLLLGSSNYTVQIVLLVRGTGSYPLISFRSTPNGHRCQFSAWAGDPFILLYTAGSVGSSGDTLPVGLNSIFSISGSKAGTSTRSFANGSFKSGNWANSSVSNGCWLFRDDEGFRGDGNIYSVRVYNRQLSDAEVLANYEIDKKIFGAI